jgi:hypothetical protein
MLDSLILRSYSSMHMPHWLAKSLCLIVALGVLDGHLMLAQTWAWANMVQNRTAEQGVSQALDSTFSGDAPCPMCCAIQNERQKKEKEAPLPELKPSAKFPPALLTSVALPCLQSGTLVPVPLCNVNYFTPHEEAPPSPPPRRLT